MKLEGNKKAKRRKNKNKVEKLAAEMSNYKDKINRMFVNIIGSRYMGIIKFFIVMTWLILKFVIQWNFLFHHS